VLQEIGCVVKLFWRLPGLHAGVCSPVEWTEIAPEESLSHVEPPSRKMEFQSECPVPLLKSRTAESLEFAHRLTTADSCVNRMTAIENKRGRLLLVSGGWRRTAVQDHIAAGQCKGTNVSNVASHFP
jgi:hypothetical protein